jgi:hypothetical protein
MTINLHPCAMDISRLAHVDHRQPHPGVVDFERFASTVHLAHHRRTRRPLPEAKVAEELSVLVAVGLAGQIPQPKQAQCHAAATQLPLDHLPLRQRTVRVAKLARREQPLLERRIVQR